MALAPLKPFGLKRALVTTLQAVSGAGYPGVASLDALGNVIPYIGGEEEKVESEPQKILGDLIQEGEGDSIRPLPMAVSATCTRVPAIDGHLATVSLEFERKPGREEILQALSGFRGLPQERQLPSAPRRPVHVMDAPDRPQTRKDAHLERGMAASVAPRVPALPSCWRSPTTPCAAGAALLNAELMHSEGLLDA